MINLFFHLQISRYVFQFQTSPDLQKIIIYVLRVSRECATVQASWTSVIPSQLLFKMASLNLESQLLYILVFLGLHRSIKYAL